MGMVFFLDAEAHEMLQVLYVANIFIHKGDFEPLDRPLGPPPKPSIMEAIFPSHLRYAY